MVENLNKKLEEINEKINILADIENKKKEKQLGKVFKVNAGKAKRGFIPILYLKNSGAAELFYIKPTDGFYRFNEKFYAEEPKAYWIFGKKKIPLVIIPEWALKPICRDDLFELDENQNNLQDHVSYAVKAIEYAELQKIAEEQGKIKKKMNPKMLLLFLVLIIGAFVLFQKFKGG